MSIVPAFALVWALVVFAWVANYVLRMALPALLPLVIPDLGLSYAGAGVLAGTAFFWAYALTQFPAGLLGDRFGRRRVLVAGLLVGAAGGALTGLAASFAGLFAARVLTGLGQGSLFSNDRAIIASVTPRERLALGQAVSFSGPGLGITAGLLLGGLLGEVLPWRQVFLVLALLPAAAALAAVRFLPAARAATAETSLLDHARRVLAQPQLWALGATGATGMWVEYVIATWGTVLFMEAGVREVSVAGFYSSLQGLAVVAGLWAGGWLSDRLRAHGLGHKVVIATHLGVAAACTVGLGAAIQVRASPAWVGLALMAATFFVWAIWGPCFAQLGEAFEGRDLSTAFGLFNTISVVGAVLGPAAAGLARDASGSFAAGCYLSAAVGFLGVATAAAMWPAFRWVAPAPRAGSR